MYTPEDGKESFSQSRSYYISEGGVENSPKDGCISFRGWCQLHQ